MPSVLDWLRMLYNFGNLTPGGMWDYWDPYRDRIRREEYLRQQAWGNQMSQSQAARSGMTAASQIVNPVSYTQPVQYKYLPQNSRQFYPSQASQTDTPKVVPRVTFDPYRQTQYQYGSTTGTDRVNAPGRGTVTSASGGAWSDRLVALISRLDAQARVGMKYSAFGDPSFRQGYQMTSDFTAGIRNIPIQNHLAPAEYNLKYNPYRGWDPNKEYNEGKESFTGGYGREYEQYQGGTTTYGSKRDPQGYIDPGGQRLTAPSNIRDAWNSGRWQGTPGDRSGKTMVDWGTHSVARYDAYGNIQSVTQVRDGYTWGAVLAGAGGGGRFPTGNKAGRGGKAAGIRSHNLQKGDDAGGDDSGFGKGASPSWLGGPVSWSKS